MKLRNLTVAFVMMAVASSASAQDHERAIREFADGWIAGANAEDLEGFLQFVSDDAVIMMPGVPAIIGKSSIRDVYRDYYTTYDLEYSASIEELEVMGKVAYVWAIVRGSRTTKASGEREETTYNNIWMLRRHPDGWKFWRAMFNSTPSAQQQ